MLTSISVCSVEIYEVLYVIAFSAFASSALTLLVGQQQGHLACK